jgi:hypothetical protein
LRCMACAGDFTILGPVQPGRRIGTHGHRVPIIGPGVRSHTRGQFPAAQVTFLAYAKASW